MVGRLVSMQPPWSMATSMMAEPGFMRSTMARVTMCGGAGAGYQDGADHDVGGGHGFSDGIGIRQAGLDSRDVLHDVAQFAGVAVERGDPRAGGGGSARGGEPDRTRAQDDHARGRHTGRTAQQDAASAGTGTEKVGGDGGGHLAGHLR